MKSLDQDGRAALRRLGVRFGAYHIFVPALLKPAPAGLVTLLWALKNDGKDKPGFGDVVHALAAGRTSVVVDPAFERSLLQARRLPHARPPRRAHRHSGAAGRPDPPGAVLEARHRRSGPDGAFDGSGFTVTPPMMSILGANADDMEEILKGLGYRAGCRGRPPRSRRGSPRSTRRTRGRAKPPPRRPEADEGSGAAGRSGRGVDAAPVADAEAAAAAEQAAELPSSLRSATPRRSAAG